MSDGTDRRSLRLWPGLAAAVLLLLIEFMIPAIAPGAIVFGIPIGMVALPAAAMAGVAILVWWLFFSRAAWSERAMALAAMVIAIVAVRPLLHESMAGAGMGMFFYFFAVQSASLALVAWALASRRLSGNVRLVSLIAIIGLAVGGWTLVRTSGITGIADSDLHWRWTPTAEERMLAQARDERVEAAVVTPAAPATPAATTPLNESRADVAKNTAVVPTPAAETPGKRVDEEAADAASRATDPRPESRVTRAERPATSERSIRRVEWDGFRGPHRDGVVAGIRINTDWAAAPPRELWRKPIGPGWSSFAVSGDLIYTQEQRGEDEVVSCYRISTGAPVWRHRDPVRFYESNGGAGPRGTPAVHAGRVFAMGATGILNALDAASGARLWSRNTIADAGVEIPGWGIASSPLVVDDLVIVAVSGRLAAYDVQSGSVRWLGPEGGGGYASPHLLTLEGVPQVVLLRGSRTISVAPADGSLLWEHRWTPGAGYLQPAMTAEGDVLITVGEVSGLGMRRVAVKKGADGWSAEERWTSRGLKPYFNDFVVHKGHAYGFDGSILASIDLNDGERKWKGGRYGNGQMILLADQDLLLVTSEEGEIALVSATPDKFTEIARVPALTGKTWNHPVIVGDVLLVRNGEEMAAFRLPVVRSTTE